MICFAKTTVTESRSEVERLSAVEWLGHISKQGYYDDRPAN